MDGSTLELDLIPWPKETYCLISWLHDVDAVNATLFEVNEFIIIFIMLEAKY